MDLINKNKSKVVIYHCVEQMYKMSCKHIIYVQDEVYFQIRDNFHYAETWEEIGIEGEVKGIP